MARVGCLSFIAHGVKTVFEREVRCVRGVAGPNRRRSLESACRRPYSGSSVYL
jgi:hypothetical protein